MYTRCRCLLTFIDNFAPPDYDDAASEPQVGGVARDRGEGVEGETNEEGRQDALPDSSGQGQWRRVTSYGAAVTQSVARGNPSADGRLATLFFPL